MKQQVSENLDWKPTEGGIRFEFRGEQSPTMPLAQNPVRVQESLRPPQVWSTLEQTWSQDSLEQIEPGSWVLSYDAVYSLGSDQLYFLNIPNPTPLIVNAEPLGIPGRPGLRLKIDVRDIRQGRLVGSDLRIGPFYVVPATGRLILMPKALWDLIRLSEAGPEEDTHESHFQFLAEAQQLGKRCGAGFEGILKRETYYFPDELQIDVREENPEELELEPSLAGEDMPEVDSERLLGEKVPTFHNFPSAGGRRRRVVLGKDLKERLSALRETRSIKGPDVPRFIENPEAFLPEGIDLEHFSKRVKGLKTVVYNSRPYIHVKRDRGGWFEGVPGVTVESVSTDETDPESGPECEIDPETYSALAEEARETGQEYVRFGKGWLKVDPSNAEQFLNRVDQFEKAEGGTVRIPTHALLDIYENLDQLEFDLPPIESLGLHIDWGALPDVPIPSRFIGQLKAHQILGYHWLSQLDQKSTGGLLADEMGLGKTVQVIAHMSRLAESGRLSPCLIICPKTIITNWQREIAKFFPSHGSIYAVEGGPVSSETLSQVDIVIMSYDTLRRNQFELGKVDWQFVVGDEAQFAKNPTAQRTTALKALKSGHRVALTGTPVENGLIEFWCIMDFVRPGLLKSWSEFRDDYEKPLLAEEDAGPREGLVRSLLEQIGPHYLRRLKEHVLADLPGKSMRVLKVNLSREQQELYRRIASDALEGGRGAALGAITQLLMLCGHPSAVSSAAEPFPPREGASPKLDQTLDLLEEIKRKGEKVVIFTRYVSLQNVLQTAILLRFGLRSSIINGQINQNRQQIIDIFSAIPGFNVLILSHDVGGVGLNITSANHVIHYTRPWNPAKENQATDRVHRIGQERDVHVYYPVVTSDEFVTVEERLAELLDAKSSLARDVLRPSKEMQVHPAELLESVRGIPLLEESPSVGAESDELSDEPSVEETMPAKAPVPIQPREPEETARPAIHEARPQTDKFSPDRSPIQELVDIGDGQKGLSYKRLFLPYLKGARSIELVDPFIRKPHQIRNLFEFVDLVKTLGAETKLKLNTSVETPDEKREVDGILKGLTEDVVEHGVEFEYHFRPYLHDRWIRTDTGWRIIIGRGLDIFSPFDRRSPAASDQTKRRCKRTFVAYHSTQD